MKNLLVNEIYEKPVVQGEGSHIGLPVMFLRLAVCNLRCWWCDTPYAVWFEGDNTPHRDGKTYRKQDEIHPMTIEEVVERLYQNAGSVRNLVISGGEPMLQQEALRALLQYLKLEGWGLEIETAATIPIQDGFDWYIDQFNCSPKLSNSLNVLQKRYKPAVLDQYQATGKAIWKFVVERPEDFAEVDKIVQFSNLSPVYIMPEGIDKDHLAIHTNAVIDEIIQRGYYLAPRLHISLWGNARGK